VKKFQNKPLLFGLVVSLLIIFFVFLTSLSNKTTLGINSLLQVPAKVATYIVQTGYELLHFKSIANENRRLLNETGALRSKVAALDEAASENKRLKELLAVKDKLPTRAVASRVTARDFSNWSESLIIDKGSKDGVHEDMAVLANGAVIGKVTAAGRSSARISLITDPEIRVAVVSQRGRVGGLLYGIGRGRSIMKFIPKEADIKPGDLIVTSSVSGIYPKGYLVGKVLSVKYELNRLYQFAVIEPAVKAMAVEEVIAVE
jgi:rod shape-determining protein MreC